MQNIPDIHQRRTLLVDLIGQGLGSSQQALVDALAGQGIAVTQATLSRDLKELSAVKGPHGYAVDRIALDPLAEALRSWMDSALAARNLVVLRTPPGGASPLAVALDNSEREDILGTIAGDDTIMVVTPSDSTAKALALEFTKAAAKIPPRTSGSAD